MFAQLNPHSSDFGDICASCAPFLPQPTMYVVLASYGLVHATVGVGTVLIWDFCVAITRGGGAGCEDVDRIAAVRKIRDGELHETPERKSPRLRRVGVGGGDWVGRFVWICSPAEVLWSKTRTLTSREVHRPLPPPAF